MKSDFRKLARRVLFSEYTWLNEGSLVLADFKWLSVNEASKKQSLLSQLLKYAKPLLRKASPYLEPEDSPFSPSPGTWRISSYELQVARALLEPIELEARGEGYKEIASVVCLPSFEPEWAVWVAGERKTGFSALLTEAKGNNWYGTLTAETQVSVAPVRMYQLELPTDRAGAICDIWKRILAQTRYPQESALGCDGVDYNFAYWAKGSPPLAGKIWSPEETTVPGKLADYCSQKDVLVCCILYIISERLTQEDHLEWFQTHSQQFF